MFFKKKKRSDWMEGLLLAEEIIQRGDDIEQVYFAVGCTRNSMKEPPVYEINNHEATRGAFDYLHFKGVSY